MLKLKIPEKFFINFMNVLILIGLCTVVYVSVTNMSNKDILSEIVPKYKELTSIEKSEVGKFKESIAYTDHENVEVILGVLKSSSNHSDVNAEKIHIVEELMKVKDTRASKLFNYVIVYSTVFVSISVLGLIDAAHQDMKSGRKIFKSTLP